MIKSTVDNFSISLIICLKAALFVSAGYYCGNSILFLCSPKYLDLIVALFFLRSVHTFSGFFTLMKSQTRVVILVALK